MSMKFRIPLLSDFKRTVRTLTGVADHRLGLDRKKAQKAQMIFARPGSF
jgi:hypothetical protein